MKHSMKTLAKTAFLATTFSALAGCASLGGNKVLKAPCASPTAGLTDPCGNRTPINSEFEVDSVLQGWTVDT